MNGPGNLILSIMMIAVLLLAGGGVWMARTRDRAKGVLMMIAAVVLLANVLIVTV